MTEPTELAKQIARHCMRITVGDRGGRMIEGIDELLAPLREKLQHEEKATRIAIGIASRLEAECDNLRQQAQIWKQEAQTQRSTVHKCYQAVTGSTGEPGDWNGAKPVVELVKDFLQEEEKRLEAECEVQRLKGFIVENVDGDHEEGCSARHDKDGAKYRCRCNADERIAFLAALEDE